MKNPFKQYPIRKTFFITFSIFIALLLFIIAFVSYSVSLNQMKENTTYYQQKLLREKNEKITLQKKSIEEVTLAMSRNSDLQAYIRGEQNEYEAYRDISLINKSFFNIAFSVPLIDSIHVFLEQQPLKDRTGPIHYFSMEDFASSKQLAHLKDADASWVPKHKIESLQGEIDVVSYARKVYDGNQKARSVIVVNIKADKFKDMIIDEKTNVNRLLIDSSNTPITYVGELGGGTHIAMENLKDNSEVNLNTEGSVKYEDNLVVWSKLFGSEWILIEMTPWEDVSMGSIQLSFILISIGVFALGIAILINYQISRQFTNPLHILLNRMENFSLEKKDANLPDDYHNEFGSLFKRYQSLIHRIYTLYDNLESEYKKKRKAEVETLQANINPHFLYNTLDQLNWMAIEADQPKISKVLELTGKMLRIGLSKGESFIPIKDEIYHMESYLQIQQIRLGKSLKYSIQVEEAYLSSYMPKLTLQPFVENSIIHGFHNRDYGHIDIRMCDIHGYLYVIIKDDGKGFDMEENQQAKKTTGGYGIKNVKDRLEVYFGDKYSLNIKSKPDNGTIVVIKIPIIRNPEMIGVLKDVESSNN
ncbi:cache domain-containing sensor histidine kinase [Sutcliffiella horikoshii]|uniref:cache domain-containing sensor histidine kinase n=1 Tax=Sutcliffiella horikoshii TaxID=79883 RepID=UPI001CFE70D6|nr:sensor histidine kinase [Sutcliffiella horikoshii]